MEVKMTLYVSGCEPRKYVTRHEALRYLESRAHGLKKSLRLLEKDNEHLTIRCPLSGDYVDVVSTENNGDTEWVYNELVKRNWLRPIV